MDEGVDWGRHRVWIWRRLHLGVSTCADCERGIDVWDDLGLFVTPVVSEEPAVYDVCFYVSIVCCCISDMFWGGESICGPLGVEA